MQFKSITIDDLDVLIEALSRYTGRMCDISPGNLVFWRDYYEASYCIFDGDIVIRFGDMDGELCYYAAMNDRLISELIKENGGSVRLTCLCDTELEYLKERYDVSGVMISEDWNDYLYLADDIVTLAGKRFSGQRNHINKFKKLYPDAIFKEIEAAEVEKVKAFCHGYFHEFGNERAEVAGYEEEHIYEQLDSLEAYKQKTGVLMLDGTVLGFSIGEVVGDTLIIHTEKANTAYDGVYPMLVQSFARLHATGGVKFINREEDCGVQGLRTSKRSYHPIEILNKYSVVVR